MDEREIGRDYSVQVEGHEKFPTHFRVYGRRPNADGTVNVKFQDRPHDPEPRRPTDIHEAEDAGIIMRLR